MRPCRRCGLDDRLPAGHCKNCSRTRKKSLTSELALKPCVSCGLTDRNKRGDCKFCSRQKSLRWRREKAHALSTKCKKCESVDRDANGNCRPCAKERGREWHRTHKLEVNPRNRLRKYGLTQEEFDRFLTSQEGKCAICEDLLLERFAVDHDHDTGLVRGLLCNQCNLGLGLFKDSPDVLARASAYLAVLKLKVAG